MRKPCVEEVFLVLRDCFVNQGCRYEEFVSRVSLDSSISVLLDLHLSGFLRDGLDIVELLLDLQERLGLPVDFDDEISRRFHKGTVRDLCVFLCLLINPPEIRPVTILGKSCESAGAFRAIQDILSKSGVDDSIRPSTPIEPLLWKHSGLFNTLIRRLAPGRVPPVVWSNTALCTCLGICGIFGPLTLALFAVRQSNWLWSLAMALLAFVLMLCFRHRRFWSVSFGNLHDFRDLVNAILDRPQRIVGERGA